MTAFSVMPASDCGLGIMNRQWWCRNVGAFRGSGTCFVVPSDALRLVTRKTPLPDDPAGALRPSWRASALLARAPADGDGALEADSGGGAGVDHRVDVCGGAG